MSELCISMAEPKEKLRNLRTLIPNAPNELIYKFGPYLADFLNDELVPEGFLLGYDLALYDLQKGVDGFTGKPIQNGLVGYPAPLYALLRLEIPRIAEAVFPTDFAEAVKKCLIQINTALKKA